MKKKKPDINTVAQSLGSGLAIAVGIAMGGGPYTQIATSSIAPFISSVLSDYINRALSTKETARVTNSSNYIVVEIDKKLKECKIRDDDFFSADVTNRSDGSELFEGVLQKSKNTYEEKKLPYISNLFINTIFDSSITSGNANQILNKVEQLSFRQLTILSFIGSNKGNIYNARTVGFRENTGAIKIETEFILQDFVQLNSFGLIVRTDNTTIIDSSDIIPGATSLTELGEKYYQILSLDTMKEDYSFLQQL